MKTLNNKYTKWYWELIETRRYNTATDFTMCHHIVPRSLGGTDDKDNLINLSNREHFVAHLLLSKMFTGKDKSKMRFAARQMIGFYTPSSRIYEMVKRDANNAVRALWKDPIWREKVIEERKIRLADPTERAHMSERMIEVWSREEYRKKHSESMKRVCNTPEARERNSNDMLAAWKDPAKKKNLLKNRRPPTDEIRKIQSTSSTEANKKSWADPAVREKRIAGIKAAIAKKKAAEAAILSSESVTD